MVVGYEDGSITSDHNGANECGGIKVLNEKVACDKTVGNTI